MELTSVNAFATTTFRPAQLRAQQIHRRPALSPKNYSHSSIAQARDRGGRRIAWSTRTLTLQKRGPAFRDSCRVRSASTAGERPAEGSEVQGTTSGTTNADILKTAEEDVPTFWNPKISPRIRGIMMLNGLTFLFGSNIAVLKDIQDVGLDAPTLTALRFAIAAACFAPLLPRALASRTVLCAGAELGAWLGSAYLAQAIGLATAQASRASFLSSFTVIAVPMLAGLTGARIPAKTWLAAGLALAGAACFELGGGGAGGAGVEVGDVWVLASAVLFGVQMLRTEAYAHLISEDDTLPLIGVQVTAMAVVSGLAAAGLHGADSGAVMAAGQDLHLASLPWLPLVYTGVVTSALCLWLEVVAMRDVSASDAALVYTLEPLWGAFFAYVLLQESMTPEGWLGAAFIMSGAMVSTLGGSSDPAQDATTPAHASPPSDREQDVAIPVPTVGSYLSDSRTVGESMVRKFERERRLREALAQALEGQYLANGSVPRRYGVAHARGTGDGHGREDSSDDERKHYLSASRGSKSIRNFERERRALERQYRDSDGVETTRYGAARASTPAGVTGDGQGREDSGDDERK